MSKGWPQINSVRRDWQTDRLHVVAAFDGLAAAVAEFYEVNRSHLQPWSPPYTASLVSVEGQRGRLGESEAAFRSGQAWKWFFFEKSDPEEVAGFVHYSQIVRGASQSAMLGYAVAAKHQGKGLMSEAIETTLEEAFSPRGRLHRVQANVVPENARSLALLERLGFQKEGLARQYIFIDEAWKDHVMMATLNSNYDPRWLS